MKIFRLIFADIFVLASIDIAILPFAFLTELLAPTRFLSSPCTAIIV